jgi:hypothetical protein
MIPVREIKEKAREHGVPPSPGSINGEQVLQQYCDGFHIFIGAMSRFPDETIL